MSTGPGWQSSQTRGYLLLTFGEGARAVHTVDGYRCPRGPPNGAHPQPRCRRASWKSGCSLSTETNQLRSLLLVVLLQLVFQRVRPFSGAVLGIPKSSSALLVFSVRVDQTRRLNRKLVIFKRAVFWFSCIVCKETDVLTVRSECCDFNVTGRVGFFYIGKSLVSYID